MTVSSMPAHSVHTECAEHALHLLAVITTPAVPTIPESTGAPAEWPVSHSYAKASSEGSSACAHKDCVKQQCMRRRALHLYAC
jgi:hypothetical protein